VGILVDAGGQQSRRSHISDQNGEIGWCKSQARTRESQTETGHEAAAALRI
jgi:hypothetical protein